MPIVAISGITGFLGAVVAQACRNSGWQVRGLVQREPGPDERRVVLGQSVGPEVFAGCAAFVHCAYDFRPTRQWEITAVNVEGSRKLFAAAVQAEVSHRVFISSMSAFPGCHSRYGQAKLAIERLAAEVGVGTWSIRPGLLFSTRPGGMVGRLRWVARLPVVPLADGGGQILYFTSADELATRIARALDEGWAGYANPSIAAAPRPYSFRQVIELLAPPGRRVRFISVPSGCLLAPLRFAEGCGLGLPFKSDSLISLLHQDPRPRFDVELQLNPTT
jgi:nucleoside-diphosphate-sugar epimerase